MSRLSRRLLRWLTSHLYQDDNGRLNRSIMVAGTARSGTTWLAEIVATQLACRIMFEPFHPHKVREYRSFGYQQYLRPSTENQELAAYCHQLFSGRIRHSWIDREVNVLRPDYRLVKEVRANLFLKWIHQRFPQVPLLFIMRHPCAVVSSHLRLQWSAEQDMDSFLRQPQLMTDFLSAKTAVIEKARSDAARIALVWCITNIVALRQFAPGTLPIVFYEQLITRPEAVVPAVFRQIGAAGFHDLSIEAVRRPSGTSKRPYGASNHGEQVARWQNELSPRQIDDVLNTVAEFELDALYDDSPMPRTTNLAPSIAGDLYSSFPSGNR